MNGKNWVILAFLLTIQSMYADFTEDFSNRQSSLASWSGTWDSFCINSWQQLQTNADSTGEHFVLRPCNVSIESEWSFWTRIYGGTSAYNLTRFYLLTSDSITGDSWYVQIGGANKNIALYKCHNGESQKIIENTNRRKILPDDDASVWIRLSRGLDGLLHLYSQVESVDEQEIEEGACFIDMMDLGYVALYAKNSKLRGRDMYFDDITVAGDVQTQPLTKEKNQEENLLHLQLQNETITLNGDGFEDEAIVKYMIPSLDYAVTMSVFSSDGCLRAIPYKNYSLDMYGNLVWNGLDISGNKVEIGVYLMIVELTNLSTHFIVRKRFPVAVFH